MKKIVTLVEALGKPLAHDITEVRPGEFKGAAFRKGHVVQPEDLDHLRRIGKDHLYIMEVEDDELHEDDAVMQLADALCGEGVFWEGEPREGKMRLKAKHDGLLKINKAALLQFNCLGDTICGTKHDNTVVMQGEAMASTRAVPLTVKKDVLRQAEAICAVNPAVVRVLPLKPVKAGVLITGNEVYYGRIKDQFENVIRQKVETLGGSVLKVIFVPDDDILIARATAKLLKAGVDMIITTGGMSVDPDDRTRHALKQAGAEAMVYGTGVQPGAMLLTAKIGGIPVINTPACALHSKVTAFDLVYPRLVAGETITRRDLAELSYGGLCLHCEICNYPVCPFGKA